MPVGVASGIWVPADTWGRPPAASPATMHVRRPDRKEGPDSRPDPLVTSLVELSEADSKKWSSLLERRFVPEEPVDRTPESQGRMLKQRQTRLTEAQKDELVAQYVNDSTVGYLAEQFGCHRNTVSNLLKSRGITLRCGSMTESHIDQAVALYESELSLARVGNELGFDDGTIRHRLVKRGVCMRDSHGRTRSDIPNVSPTASRSGSQPSSYARPDSRRHSTP